MSALARVKQNPAIKRVHWYVKALCISYRLNAAEKRRNTNSAGWNRFVEVHANEYQKSDDYNRNRYVFLHRGFGHVCLRSG